MVEEEELRKFYDFQTSKHAITGHILLNLSISLACIGASSGFKGVTSSIFFALKKERIHIIIRSLTPEHYNNHDRYYYDFCYYMKI